MAEIQASHNCLQRTLHKDSNDSFNEVTQNFQWKLKSRVQLGNFIVIK